MSLLRIKFWAAIIFASCLICINTNLCAQEKDIISYLHLQNLNIAAIDDLQGGELKDGAVCANNILYKSKNKHVYKVFGVQFLSKEDQCLPWLVGKYGDGNVHSETGAICVTDADYAGHRWDFVTLHFAQIPNLTHSGETVTAPALVMVGFMKYIDDENVGQQELQSIRKKMYDKYIYQYDNLSNEYIYTWNITRRLDSYYLTIHSEINPVYDCKIVCTYRSTKVGDKWRNALSLSYGNLSGHAALLIDMEDEL